MILIEVKIWNCLIDSVIHDLSNKEYRIEDIMGKENDSESTTKS